MSDVSHESIHKAFNPFQSSNKYEIKLKRGMEGHDGKNSDYSISQY